MSLLDFQFQSQSQFQLQQRELSRGHSSDVSRQPIVEPISESNRTLRDKGTDATVYTTEYQTEADRVVKDMYDRQNPNDHFNANAGDKFVSSRADNDARDRAATTVTTAPELRRAIESHCEVITVTGDLAEDLQTMSKITMLTSKALSELEAACASLEARNFSTKIFTSPNLSASTDSNVNVTTSNVSFPGGPLGGVLVAASEATGFSVSLIRTLATVGFAMILSLFDNYDIESGTSGGKIALRFRLKRRDSN